MTVTFSAATEIGPSQETTLEIFSLPPTEGALVRGKENSPLQLEGRGETSVDRGPASVDHGERSGRVGACVGG
jgi:hypothetical protein